MATQITITKIFYTNAAANGQVWTFEYKLYSASTWTLAANNKVVNSAGTLAVPLVISGLTAGQLYYVRSHNNCQSPPDYFLQEIQL